MRLFLGLILWAGLAGGVFAETVPQGELKERVALTQQRMLTGETPRFSHDFILADVKLDPAYPRRFSEYSGDLSGRYIGALSMLPPAEG